MATIPDILKVGVLGSLKKGEDWQLPPLPSGEPALSPGRQGVANTPARKGKGKEVFTNKEFTDYLVEKAETDNFKDASGAAIVTLEQVPTEKKAGRFYGKTSKNALKTANSFMSSLKDLRKTNFTKRLGKKKEKNQKEWNSLTAGISADTRVQLDAMTKEYEAKKAELDRRLEEAFKAQTKQLVINKQHETQNVYKTYTASKPNTKITVKPPEGEKKEIRLGETLNAVGNPIIESIKVGATRKKHRFIDYLVLPAKIQERRALTSVLNVSCRIPSSPEYCYSP